MDKRLLKLLRCPASGQPLHPLTSSQLEALNRAIAAGSLQYADTSPISAPLAAGLRTDSSDRIYRIDDGIPVMLVAESIATGSLAANLG